MKRVQCTMFLGLVIDESLNLKNHINVVNSKLCKVASILYKASHCADRYSLHTFYYSLTILITINCKRLDIMLPLTLNDGQIILQVIVRDCILYNAPSINCTRLDVVLPLILYNYN